MSDTANTINTDVRSARLLAGLTQVELARRAGVGLSTLRMAEKGVATQGTLQAIEDALAAAKGSL